MDEFLCEMGKRILNAQEGARNDAGGLGGKSRADKSNNFHR